MKSSIHHLSGAIASILLIASASPQRGNAQVISGNLYFTDFIFETVNEVNYTYDGAGGFTLGTPQLIQTVGGADGLIFDPAGNLLVGGQGPNLYRVNPNTAAVDTSTTPGATNFHLGLDPSGTKVWAGGIPGFLNEVPLPGFGPGTIHTVTLAGSGIPIGVDTIAFDPTHGNQAYFTSSFPNGNGLFGTIDLTTFVATPIFDPAEPLAKVSAHGLAWDSYTNKFVLFGDTEISTYDPATGLFKSESFPGHDFDQGTVDGLGHLFVAGIANLTFIDYALTGDPTSTDDFKSDQFVAAFLDDVAPLSGLGAPPVLSAVPEPSTYTLIGTSGLLLLILLRVRRNADRKS